MVLKAADQAGAGMCCGAGERDADRHGDLTGSTGEMCRLACSLSPDGLRERTEMIDRLLARGLDRLSPIPAGVRARFVSNAEIEAELRALVALEAECCEFLSMTLSAEDDAIVLEVTGPSDARPVINAMFVGGEQVVIDDPVGNPIELFQPASR